MEKIVRKVSVKRKKGGGQGKKGKEKKCMKIRKKGFKKGKKVLSGK